MTIGVPPLSSALPLGVGKTQAQWTAPWANWFSQVWTQLANYLNAPAKTVTTDNYQIKLTDSVILVNDDITVILPKAIEAIGKRITVKAVNAGAGTRTVSGNGTNIDGSATWTTTTRYVAADFVTNETGTAWNVV